MNRMMFAFYGRAEGQWLLTMESVTMMIRLRKILRRFFSVVEKMPKYLGNESVSKCTPDLIVSTVMRPFALTNLSV